MILLILICLPMSIVVVRDWDKTRDFDSRYCSGTALAGLRISTGGLAAHGSVRTCVAVSETNSSCTSKSVELYYPAVSWMLAGKDERDVRRWAAGLGAASTFSCKIENADGPGTSRGVSETFEAIWGWFLLLILGCILWGVVLVYFACNCLAQSGDPLGRCMRSIRSKSSVSYQVR